MAVVASSVVVVVSVPIAIRMSQKREVELPLAVASVMQALQQVGIRPMICPSKELRCDDCGGKLWVANCVEMGGKLPKKKPKGYQQGAKRDPKL